MNWEVTSLFRVSSPKKQNAQSMSEGATSIVAGKAWHSERFLPLNLSFHTRSTHIFSLRSFLHSQNGIKTNSPWLKTRTLWQVPLTSSSQSWPSWALEASWATALDTPRRRLERWLPLRSELDSSSSRDWFLLDTLPLTGIRSRTMLSSKLIR